MTQEEKQYLFKDLCARLPYNPHIWVKDGKTLIAADIVLNGIYINDWMTIPSCQNMTIKPYLRPIGSMTTKEFKLFAKYQDKSPYGEYDFYNEYHFDYRGLIPMGLALEAPESMYKS